MSKYDSYYAMQNAKRKFQSENPNKQFEYAGADVQERYVGPEMEKRGYKKSRYIGAGAWEWSKL